jgi:LysR family transcriptional regulator, regulator for genes of the gallate degradation pathway
LSEKQTKAQDDRAFLPSLTQLRAFAEVARIDSITRAADELHRSQSAVTQAIQSLESELGVSLFARTSTGSYLTNFGRILHYRAEKCFDRIEAVLAEILGGDADNPAQIGSIARRVTRAQIVALTAVDEYSSFAQAARHVKVSLASLHRAARTLENQVSRKLFVKTAQGIATNADGAKLAIGLNLAIRELEWAYEEIQSETGALRGRLLVGSLLLAGSNYVSAGLDRFVVAHPDVTVRLLSGPYDQLLSKLRSGSIDFLVGALKNPPPVDDVLELELGSDPYTVGVSRNHPLVGRDKVTVDDLREWEWISPGPGAQRRFVFEGIFSNGPMPRFRVETYSLLTIFILLAESHRVAVLTASEMALNRRLGNQLTALPFTIDHAPAKMGVTVRKNWEPTKLQQVFLNSLRQS